MFLTLALLAAAAPPEQAPAPKRDEIVVTGIRPEDTRRALDACLARACPPREEIAATIAHAETLFIAGDYRTARGTLNTGLRRNARHAATLPVEVSDMMRGASRVNAHLGEPAGHRVRAGQVVATLRNAFGPQDPRYLVSRIEAADAASAYNLFTAERVYLEVAREARAASQFGLEGVALLRRAWLLNYRAGFDPVLRPRAKAAMDLLVASDRPEHQIYGLAASVLEDLTAARRGDEAAIDRLAAAGERDPAAVPMLIYAPQVSVAAPGMNFVEAPVSAALAGPSGRLEDNWADIGFLIGPDGRVSDVEVLRTGKSRDTAWLGSTTRAIGLRRYAIPGPNVNPANLFRVERASMTADMGYITRSRLRQRAGPPRIVTLDITNDARTPAASANPAAPAANPVDAP